MLLFVARRVYELISFGESSVPELPVAAVRKDWCVRGWSTSKTRALRAEYCESGMHHLIGEPPQKTTSTIENKGRRAILGFLWATSSC